MNRLRIGNIIIYRYNREIYFHIIKNKYISMKRIYIIGMGDEEGDEPITNREYPGGRVGLGARVIKVYLIMIVIQIYY